MGDKKFAKLFENEETGQILVKIDSAESDEHEAEVRIYFEPDGLGVCNTAFSFNDWEDAEEAFNKVDEQLCLDIIKPLIEQFGGLLGD